MRRALVAAVLFLAACSSWDPSVTARQRAIAILDCGEVEMRQTSDNTWHATGCEAEIDVACTAGSLEPVCVQVHTSGGEEEHWAETDADAGTGEDSTRDEIEATIRRGLDAHRADVLACTQRTASVVRVAYALDGTVTITLAGDLEGSPEEGCVRSMLEGVRVTRGREGTVLHLLRGAE